MANSTKASAKPSVALLSIWRPKWSTTDNTIICLMFGPLVSSYMSLCTETRHSAAIRSQSLETKSASKLLSSLNYRKSTKTWSRSFSLKSLTRESSWFVYFIIHGSATSSTSTTLNGSLLTQTLRMKRPHQLKMTMIPRTVKRITMRKLSRRLPCLNRLSHRASQISSLHPSFIHNSRRNSSRQSHRRKRVCLLRMDRRLSKIARQNSGSRLALERILCVKPTLEPVPITQTKP